MESWTERHYILTRTDDLFVYVDDDASAVSLSHSGRGDTSGTGFDIDFTTGQLTEIRELYLALENMAKRERAEAAAARKKA
jgi:hypothetical protein